MSKLIVLAPLAFVAACAADPQPAVNGNLDVPAAAGDVVNALPTLSVGYEQVPESCVDHSVFFMPFISYSDGSSTANVVCQYQFPDGTTYDGCATTHSIPDLGAVILTAHDTVTGATATYQDIIEGPATLTASVTLTTAADTLTWHADTLYGNNQAGDVSISISPAANVIVDDPNVFDQRDGTVHVTADGTYTVTAHASIGFGEYGGCGTDASASIDVDCNGTPGN